MRKSNLRNKTYEELLDLEQELLQKDEEEEEYGYYSNFVLLYEEMHRILFRLVREGKEKYRDDKHYTERKLVFYLIKYGTYLKTIYQKDDNGAENKLNQVLRYDRENPMAHYRLGFLAYKKDDYLEALTHFQKAIQFQKNYNDAKYTLNKQQNYFAQLYLSSSALNIAKASQQSVEKLRDDDISKSVPNLEVSPLYGMIKTNEGYLSNHAFTVITPEGKKMCTKEDCEEMADLKEENTLILFFTDRQISLTFERLEEPLSLNQGEMLRYFLLYSSETEPVTKEKFEPIFRKGSDIKKVSDNTFIKAMSRLRGKLTKVGAPSNVIKNRTYDDKISYYFNRAFFYKIIHRSDDAFILD